MTVIDATHNPPNSPTQPPHLSTSTWLGRKWQSLTIPEKGIVGGGALAISGCVAAIPAIFFNAYHIYYPMGGLGAAGLIVVATFTYGSLCSTSKTSPAANA